MSASSLPWFSAANGILPADLADAQAFTRQQYGWSVETILSADEGQGQMLSVTPPGCDEAVFNITRSGAWMHVLDLDTAFAAPPGSGKDVGEVGVFQTMPEALAACLRVNDDDAE